MRISNGGTVSPTELARLETPCAIAPLSGLRSNIERMQALADRHGLALRPHVKTHKCPRIARLQLEAGAVGITCSKSEETAAFLEAGCQDVLAAYPLHDSRGLDRVLEAARSRGARVSTIAGDPASAAFLARQAQRHGVTLPVFVKIDVGLRRVGLRADHPDLIALARTVDGSPRLEFAGILSHAGHAYGASGIAEIRAVALAEAQAMALAKERIEAAGMAVRTVSVGSTPTVLAAESFQEIDEIRPGNYVFLDGTALRLGVASTRDTAFFVLAAVVAVNDAYVVVDAGSKALSSDMGPHGMRGATGYGAATDLEGRPCGVLSKLSEEHGFIERGDAPGLAPGDRILITPNHACSTANSAPRLYVFPEDGVGQPEAWDIVARGMLR
ncbi:MAG: alanine racemase [Oceanidesulfovibrio sp.]